jgi:serine/threonine protein kinase
MTDESNSGSAPGHPDAAKVGPYVPLAEMGKGGAGVVWKCRNADTNELAAVKVARDTGRRQRDLLRREIAMLARLGEARHPSVVRLIEAGNERGKLWYAMEYLDGPDLRVLLRSSEMSPFAASDEREGGPLDVSTVVRDHGEASEPAGSDTDSLISGDRRSARVPSSFSPPLEVGADEAVRIMAHLADALSLLHGEGIVHGDVTPANVVLRSDSTPVLVDFGTAFHTSAGKSAREIAQVEGLLIGTPGYMAPEQIRREFLDARCDLYSFGCLLFALLCRRPPYAGDSIPALLNQHLHRSPPPLGSILKSVDPALEDLVARLLEKDRNRRLGHASAIVTRLRSIYRGHAALPEPRSSSSIYRSSLVGRHDVVGRVSTLLEHSRNGRGGALMLVGESGIGKTRILNEIGARAIELGMDVVSSHCVSLVGERSSLRGPALHGFAPFLQRYVDRSSSQPALVTDELKESLQILAPYEPSVATLVEGKAEDTSRLLLDFALARIMRALTALLSALGKEQPLLVIVDDLHWADELTASYWMSEEIAKLESSNIALLGASRGKEGDACLQKWLGDHPDKRVDLGRLSSGDIGSVMREMLGTDLLPAGFTEAVQQATDGNPLFIAEYLRIFLQRGWLSVGPQGWIYSRPSELAPDDLPSAIRDLFDSRLAGLSADAQRMLGVAALLGRELHKTVLLSVLTTVQVCSSDEVGVALDELMGRQVVEEVGGERLRFVHDQLREAALLAIEPSRFVSMNREIARCLERLRPVLAEITDAQLGVHKANANLPEEALPYLRRAASQAEGMHAMSLAIDLFRLALRQAELLEESRGQPTNQETELCEALADALMRMAQHEEARGLLRRAGKPRPTLRPLDAARLLRKEAQSHSTVHRYEQANLILDEAKRHLPLAACQNVQEWQEWIALQQVRFWTLYFSRRTGPETVALIERMTPIVLQFGSMMQRSMLYQCASADLAGRLRFVYSAEVVSHSRRALRELDDTPRLKLERAGVLFQIGFSLVRGEEHECRQGTQILAQVAKDAESMGDVTLLARAHTYHAIGLRRLRDLEGTLIAARRAFSAAESAQLFPYLGAAAACRAWLAWASGDQALGRTKAEDARKWWSRSAHPFPFRWLVDFILLDGVQATGELERATWIVNDLLADDQQMLPEPLWSSLEELATTLASGADERSGALLASVLRLAYSMRYL